MAEIIKEQFDKHGYVVLRNCFSAEYVQKLKKEAKNVLERFQTNHTGVYVGMTIASDVFKNAAEHPELVNALREIMGNHIVFLSDKIVYKNASTDFGSPWHQDYPYWHGSNKYSVWIALDDATPENGCLRVVPGSHMSGLINHEGDASDGLGFENRLKQEFDLKQVIDLPTSQGDAVIFHDLLIHSSYPNVSGQDRWALISTYKDGTKEDPDYEWSRGAFTVSG